MKRKSPALGLLWLLMIPAQLVLASAFTVLGVRLDSGMYADKPADVPGHPVPVFIVIFAGISAVVTVIVVIVSIILTIVRIILISRNNRKIDEFEANERMRLNAEQQMYAQSMYGQSAQDHSPRPE